MKMYELIEKFAANPCGDGGDTRGFHKGNTCASGGDARKEGLLYHVEKSQPIKMSVLRKRLGHPDLTQDNPVHAMIADLVRSGEIELSLVDGEPAASLAKGAAPKKSPPSDLPSAFHDAFDAADRKNGKTNFVKLKDMRDALGVGRAEFDALLREMRKSGEYSLDSHEGLHGRQTPEERDAGIVENGSRLVYVSKRKYENFSVADMIERFAANPCGDGGSEKGFHKGNTCAKGGKSSRKKVTEQANEFIRKMKNPETRPSQSEAKKYIDSFPDKDEREYMEYAYEDVYINKYYEKRTEDIDFVFPVPPHKGVSSQWIEEKYFQKFSDKQLNMIYDTILEQIGDDKDSLDDHFGFFADPQKDKPKRKALTGKISLAFQDYVDTQKKIDRSQDEDEIKRNLETVISDRLNTANG